MQTVCKYIITTDTPPLKVFDRFESESKRERWIDVNEFHCLQGSETMTAGSPSLLTGSFTCTCACTFTWLTFSPRWVMLPFLRCSSAIIRLHEKMYNNKWKCSAACRRIWKWRCSATWSSSLTRGRPATPRACARVPAFLRARVGAGVPAARRPAPPPGSLLGDEEGKEKSASQM